MRLGFRKHGKCSLGGDDARAERLQFIESVSAILRIQSLDCVGNDRDFAVAAEQAFRGAADAKLRHDAKHDVFRARAEKFNNFGGVRIIENVERLFFEQDLRAAEKIRGQIPRGAVWKDTNVRPESSRQNPRAGSAGNTVGRKAREFGIVGRVRIAARNDKRSGSKRAGNKALDIRDELFRARDIELATRQHEICLNINGPKYEFALSHLNGA